MPLGLKSAGNTFVRAIQKVLHPIRAFSDAYVDDLSTFSDDFDSHLCDLRRFLTVIRSSGFTLNLKKCSFAKQEIKYLGHIIGCGLHRPDPNHLKAVSDMKSPTTKKQLRQVLGLFSYYRTYVKDFAAIAKPLNTSQMLANQLCFNGATQSSKHSILCNVLCVKPLCWRSLFQANPSFYVQTLVRYKWPANWPRVMLQGMSTRLALLVRS